MRDLELGPLFWRTGLGLALAIVLCISWSLAATIAHEEAIYQATGVASPLLQGSVEALAQPLPGLFLRGAPTPAGRPWAIRPLGDYSYGWGANTLCEQWVEVQTGIGNQGVTAAAAAQRLAAQGLLHQGTPPAGALVYFGPSADNEFAGHVGIAEKGGQFRSVTTFGVADAPIAGWQAPYEGYVLPGSVTSDRFGNVVTVNKNA